MKNLKIVSIFLVLLTLPFSAFSTDNGQEHSFEHGKRILLKMREKIYNFEIYDSSIYSDLAKCSLIFANETNRQEGLYWNAMSNFLYGLAKMGTKDKKVAFEYLEKGRLMLVQAIRMHGESSEMYLLLSDIYIQLLSCRGIGYQLANIRKLKEYPEKVLSLDPANVKARNPLALFWVKAPPPLGGDVDMAIKFLHRTKPTEKVDKFTTYYILGTAYWAKNELVSATKYMNMALKLYPNNRWVIDDLEVINSLYSSSAN